MTELNAVGAELGALPYVTALTDITGFGLLGHLIEICEGSGVSTEIHYGQVPLMKNLKTYTDKFIYPDNTMRNWQSFEKKVDGIGSESLLTLCDPQTSGGLLVCVQENSQVEFERFMQNLKVKAHRIGQTTILKDTLIMIQE